MKKIDILKIILVGGLLIGAGCSKESSKGSKTATKENKPIEIEYWHVASESFGGIAIKELIADFNAKNSDIKIIEKFNPDMYKGLTQNLQVAIASKKYPAIVQMGYSYLNYADSNFEYTTPQEIVDKYFPEDTKYFEKHFLNNVLELGQVNGKQVGIPYSISNPIMYVNADLFKEAGLDPNNLPKTWTEVVEAARTIKDKTGNSGFFMQEYADNWAQQALIEGNGGQILKYEGGKTIPTFATPESAEAYQLIADMVKNKTAVHATNEEAFQTFLNGKIGMVITTIGKRENFQSIAKFDLRGTKFPIFEGKSRKLPAGGNMLMMMSKDPEEQKAAWRFMKYLLSPEATEKWTKGTGYLPSTIQEKGTEIEKFISENQLMNVAASQMEDMGKWASFSGSNGLQAEQILIDTRDIILSNEKTASEALKEAQNKIMNLMK
ncbi:ABC transporter substrate-binding protein [Fusobacterium mortiferum]|uniref:ABC transporter substrate-binding protein n=1 Tax=Fusobacterium mortiferum TaxID=850 RepID=UPI001957CB72|nr:ABC transporter substrate-binding protein [Fusobacterium mortiferum]